MIYRLHDAGRSASKRPKQRRDCVVRAISLALGMAYDDTYEALAEASRTSGRSTAKDVWQPWLTARATRHSFPAVAGQKRMSLAEFCSTHPRGRWVAQCAGHVVAVVDGIPHDDSEPRSTACVYAAWEAR